MTLSDQQLRERASKLALMRNERYEELTKAIFRELREVRDQQAEDTEYWKKMYRTWGSGT